MFVFHCLTSLSMVIYGSIHVAANAIISFLFTKTPDNTYIPTSRINPREALRSQRKYAVWCGGLGRNGL